MDRIRDAICRAPSPISDESIWLVLDFVDLEPFVLYPLMDREDLPEWAVGELLASDHLLDMIDCDPDAVLEFFETYNVEDWDEWVEAARAKWDWVQEPGSGHLVMPDGAKLRKDVEAGHPFVEPSPIGRPPALLMAENVLDERSESSLASGGGPAGKFETVHFADRYLFGLSQGLCRSLPLSASFGPENRKDVSFCLYC